MRNRIANWLKAGANALEGVQLLKEACIPSFVLEMVKANPDANRRFMVRWLRFRFGIEQDVCFDSAGTDASAHGDYSHKAFRDEFPFLNDADCPPELEMLASRKFSRYHRYVELHAQLSRCASLEECRKVSRDLINAYMENQLIWQELNYYKEHKSVWGKHPIFAAMKRRKDYMNMNVKDLIHRKRQVLNNIWRVRDELKKGDKPHLEIERNARLRSYESELAEINKLLDE